MVWKEKLDIKTRAHIQIRVKQSLENKEAIKKAENPREAQLWCAIANLSKEIEDNDFRIKQIENLLVKKFKLEKNNKKSKKEQNELNQIIKSLNRL